MGIQRQLWGARLGAGCVQFLRPAFSSRSARETFWRLEVRNRCYGYSNPGHEAVRRVPFWLAVRSLGPQVPVDDLYPLVFSHNGHHAIYVQLQVFFLLRAIYGIGLGGYWGVGAALVMETCPVRWRGLFSGILQAGYSIGYLLAALTASIMEPKLGWPSMFLATLIVAGVIMLLLLPSVEPMRTAAASGALFKPWTILKTHWQSFASLTILMTVITCLSHGTQDLYPDFLMIVHRYSKQKVAELVILYNCGAGLGAIVFGRLSDRLGRKHSIYCAMSLCLLAMPAWAFGRRFWLLALGDFVMQFGVQGAFGVVPAYLNEQSPSHARSFFAGLAYQLGMFFGAPCVIVEYAFRDRLGYGGALAAFEGCVFIALALVLLRIRERPSGLMPAASS